MFSNIINTKDVFKFSCTAIAELKSMILKSSVRYISLQDAVRYLEKSYDGKGKHHAEIAKDIGVARSTITRFSSGIRGKKEHQNQKYRGSDTKSKIFSLAASKGMVMGVKGVGQIRVSSYLDIECIKMSGEVQVRFHEEFFSRYFLNTNMALKPGFFRVAEASIRGSIRDICQNSPCELVKVYSRGNEKRKKVKKCEVCGEILISKNNKKLIYNVTFRK